MCKSLSGPPVHGTDMSLHWCLDEQAVLVAAIVVIVNVVLNRRKETFPAKCMSIVTFSFEDTPEAFHRAIVNAVSHARHTWRQTSVQQFLVEDSASVLVPAVTVEHRMCIWIFLNCLVKSVKDQLVAGQNAIILFQIIPNPAVALIRVFCVNLLDRC